MTEKNIRNFVIIAHIDSGKSTLADRLLEATGTVDARRMRPQYLDQLDLERERGITIKMAPVRMHWKPSRGSTQINADSRGLLYEDLTYKIRGALFKVYNALGPGHKESVYQNSLALEFSSTNLSFEREKRIDVIYDGKKVGLYQPDFVVEGKVIVELKALPFLGDPPKKQTRHYLRGSSYRLALLVNFGGSDLEIDRIIYDAIRDDHPLNPRESAEVEEYILNLIDTPGHSDFAYEVSRALAAVEGAVLLVDGTKGIQAQTLSNFRSAKRAGLAIIGAVNKIDLDLPHVETTVRSLADLLGVAPEEILKVSAKTGAGVPELLEAVVQKLPPPPPAPEGQLRALIFDSLYNEHKGIVAYVRVVSGTLSVGKELALVAGSAAFKAKEVGYFAPEPSALDALTAGNIGYVATGLKEPDRVKIGDTLTSAARKAPALAGYREPAPVVFIAVYPDGATNFDDLDRSLRELRLSDPALSLEPEASDALGRGIKVGFLGQLHFEITASRLKDEYGMNFIASFPSVAYRVLEGGKESIVKQAKDFPDKAERVFQPMIAVEILTPPEYLKNVLSLTTVFDFEVHETENIGDHCVMRGVMPLVELLRDFDDRLKSVSSGFASFSYERIEDAPGDVVKLEILIVGDVVSALTRVVSARDVEREGRATVERLKSYLPREQFAQAIQARARGRIIARETLPALKKDVTGYLYGGDRTRKMKLWKKQQRGKKKLKSMARVHISPQVFREILKK